MNRSSSPRGIAGPAIAAAVAVIALFAFVAGTAIGRGSDIAGPGQSDRPSATPAVAPTRTPTQSPSAAPSNDPGFGSVKVDLQNLTDDDVSVVIRDDTGMLVKAESGTPGDGMSARWFELKVENLDAETLRLTWVGLPVDDEVALSMSYNAGIYRLRMVQAAPPPNSDALGFDRILVLHFDAPISAEDVHATIQEGLDTAG